MSVGRTAALTVTLIALVGLLAACGASSAEKGPPGSPSNPLVGKPITGHERTPDALRTGAASTPGDRGLVAGRSRKPKRRFTPCSLVTKSQAAAIIGEPIREPVQAAQGPTCIYRSTTGSSFITLVVQRVDFKRLRPQIRERRRIAIASRSAYCGTYGQQMLYMPLAGSRVLSIAGPCDIARQFATEALPQLGG
jgi:hypothetical protein